MIGANAAGDDQLFQAADLDRLQGLFHQHLDDRILEAMRSHAGVASRMFEALAKDTINIQMISTSEIKVSVVIEEKYLELAVRALHTAFDLDAPARQAE